MANTDQQVLVDHPSSGDLSSTGASSTPSNDAVEDCPVAFLDTAEGRKIAYRKREGTLPGVVYIHGFQSDMLGRKANALDEYCKGKGVAFIRFDLSGHGLSSEPFKNVNVSMWLEDLTAIMDMLTTGPQVLIGSSLGGWLMLLYTMRNPDRVAGLLGVASAVDFTQRLWKNMEKEKREQLKRTGVFQLHSPYLRDPIDITMDFIMDGEKHGILDMPGIQLIKAPVWLLHGDQDSVVPPQVSISLMHKLECSVELKVVKGGDHRLSSPENLSLMLQGLAELLPNSKTRKESDQDDED